MSLEMQHTLASMLLAGVVVGTSAFVPSCKREERPSAPPPAAEAPARPVAKASPSVQAPAKTPEPNNAGPESTKGPSRMWSFEDAPAGVVATGFVAAVGRWEVVTDEASPSGSRVLAQLATSEDDIFNVTLISDTSYRDLDVSVRLRAVSGRVDQGGGIVWRARDPRNYYIARYNPLEDNFRVYKVVNGRRRMLESATLRIDHAAWHTLRIVMRGDHIECYLDGNKHLDVHDATFSDAGRLGLLTKADAQTYFDDLAVAVAPAPTREQ